MGILVNVCAMPEDTQMMVYLSASERILVTNFRYPPRIWDGEGCLLEVSAAGRLLATDRRRCCAINNTGFECVCVPVYVLWSGLRGQGTGRTFLGHSWTFFWLTTPVPALCLCVVVTLPASLCVIFNTSDSCCSRKCRPFFTQSHWNT